MDQSGESLQVRRKDENRLVFRRRADVDVLDGAGMPGGEEWRSRDEHRVAQEPEAGRLMTVRLVQNGKKRCRRKVSAFQGGLMTIRPIACCLLDKAYGRRRRVEKPVRNSIPF